MVTQIATLGCCAVIALLFWLDLDNRARPSRALWLPVIWLAIGGSRNPGAWFLVGGALDFGEQLVEGSPLDRSILAALIALGVGTLWRRQNAVKRLLTANLPVIFFFGYCGLSVLWSDFPFVAVKRWFRGIGDVVMVLVVLSDPEWMAAIKRLFTRVAFVFLPMSLLFMRYYPELGRSYGRDGSQYWTGVASGKNGLGMICLIFGVALVWRWLLEFQEPRSRGRAQRLSALSGTILLALWLTLQADSKTSLACLVLVGGLMAVLTLFPFTRRPAILHCVVWSLVLSCISVLFLGVGSSALEAIGRDSSLTGRTDVWEIALRCVENPVLGEGYESFWLGPRLKTIAQVNGGSPMHQAHNGYIEIYLNLGALGVILLASIVACGYRRIIGGFRSAPEISMLRVAFFVVAVIYNFTEGSFKMMSPVWISFLLAILIRPVGSARSVINLSVLHGKAVPIRATAF